MSAFAEHIWNSKYRYRSAGAARDADVAATWDRVAGAIAAIEPDPMHWRRAFRDLLEGCRFLPGGRILAGAGTAKEVTLFNCFVMGAIHDSIESIFDALKESAVTMQHGGGIGCDFSALRPAGTRAVSSGATASGPVSFMHIWNALCETLLATSTRRGAMMATLRCDHPDIIAFIRAKHEQGALENFNLSVLVSDDFMRAVSEDADWRLRFPGLPAAGPGSPAADEMPASLPARRLWEELVGSARDSAEPGVLFIDTINRDNNLYYCEEISATNPCGEIPLPPYGACNLGSVNLATLVRQPFENSAALDEQSLSATVAVAVRFLDDVIDVSRFPLERQAERARATRRVGLGVTGLADMLVMLGLHYDSDEGRAAAAKTLRLVRDAAYRASISLAEQKGAFPLFDRDRYLAAPFVARLPAELRSGIAESGIRNSHLLAIAPTGTISLLADNVSSGIEPIYSLEAERDIRGEDLRMHRFKVRDHAYGLWLGRGGNGAPLPDSFVTTEELEPRAHLEMQACLQQYVDNAISKTINLPSSATVEAVADTYTRAHALGLKGCTVFRQGAISGQVLHAREASHCCHVDREAD